MSRGYYSIWDASRDIGELLRGMYDGLKKIVSIGSKGAIIGSGVIIVLSTLTKIGLKLVTDCDEYKLEKYHRYINHVLGLNIVYFINSSVDALIFKHNENYNVIIFFSIAAISIIEYILIKKQIRKRRNK